jgi:hypothetical protein
VKSSLADNPTSQLFRARTRPTPCHRNIVVISARERAASGRRDVVDANLYLEQAGFVTGELNVVSGQSAGH